MSKELLIASAVVILLIGAYLVAKRKKIEKYTTDRSLWILTQEDGTSCGKIIEYYAVKEQSAILDGVVYKPSGVSETVENSMMALRGTSAIRFYLLMKPSEPWASYTIDDQGRYIFPVNGVIYRFERISSRSPNCLKPGLD